MLQLVYNRLLTSAAFAAVQICEDIDAIATRAGRAADGTIFVAPYRERARPPRDATGGHMQLVEVQFVTALLIRQHDDALGATRAIRFDELKGSVEQQLAGWQPSEGSDVISLVGGESSSLGNGVSIYAQTWQTTRFLTGGIS